ncbi:nitroreductase [Paraburkholderia acidicola]|uniref:Nitroreductase n=1 Tax=Paraburkholderia acidicola TaxID=1912599 RepID=A0ABV1M0Q3_9BURK
MSDDVSVVEALMSRRSVRAFLPDPVDEHTLRRIFECARRAPSGSNIQPWKAWVMTGESRDALSRKLLAAVSNPDTADEHEEEYAYYPRNWHSPYLERRRELGWALYSTLGIERGNKDGMQVQHARNFAFFDAPVGIMFTIDRQMEQGSWLDYGMFLQNIMLMARAFGLDTCPQAAFNRYHRIVAEHLQLPPTEMLVCGMSLGYADPSQPENGLVSTREPVDGFVHFLNDAGNLSATHP